MNFEPSEEQARICRAVREFGGSLNSDMPARDAGAVFDRDLWRRCAEFGLPGLPVPPEYGGSGESLLTTLLALEALGYACRDNGLVFSLNAQMWAFELPLVRFGTEEQKQRCLPRICRGEWIGAHAITEPESGSDVMSMSTRAVRDGDHYVLDGAKTFVTNGPAADVVLAFATVNRELRAAGITAFLVERDTPGMTLSRPIPKMGLRTSPMGEVSFQGCRIPATQRVGAEGAGALVFNSAMEWERACIFASHLGAMQRVLEQTISYAKTRRQFGLPISRHPAVADRIVDMRVAIEAGRLLLYKAGATRDAGRNAVLEAAMAKLYCSEVMGRVVDEAVQIHGGYGLMKEYNVERFFRDYKLLTIGEGTSEVQRIVISRKIGCYDD